MTDALRLLVRTPHALVADLTVSSARVPTSTGQVGLRPRQEPYVLVVEPGLILLHTTSGLRFAASAGGLLECDREQAQLLTPFAVVGERDSEVLDALDHALTAPDSELSARRRLGELEQRIVRELRQRPRPRTRRELP